MRLGATLRTCLTFAMYCKRDICVNVPLPPMCSNIKWKKSQMCGSPYTRITAEKNRVMFLLYMVVAVVAVYLYLQLQLWVVYERMAFAQYRRQATGAEFFFFFIFYYIFVVVCVVCELRSHEYNRKNCNVGENVCVCVWAWWVCACVLGGLCGEYENNSANN